MKYFNLFTKTVKEMDRDTLELQFNEGSWVDYDKILNEIVLVSVNDFKIYPKDELGLNKKSILKSLDYFKPACRQSAFRIAKYYKVCPYCKNELKVDGDLILDCRESFQNIKRMQVDVYNETVCCNNTFWIPLSKTYGTLKRADFIKEQMLLDKFVAVTFDFKHLDIAVLIDIDSIIDDIGENFSDYWIMKKVFKNGNYLMLKDNETIHLETSEQMELQNKILAYLTTRR